MWIDISEALYLFIMLIVWSVLAVVWFVVSFYGAIARIVREYMMVKRMADEEKKRKKSKPIKDKM